MDTKLPLELLHLVRSHRHICHRCGARRLGCLVCQQLQCWRCDPNIFFLAVDMVGVSDHVLCPLCDFAKTCGKCGREKRFGFNRQYVMCTLLHCTHFRLTLLRPSSRPTITSWKSYQELLSLFP